MAETTLREKIVVDGTEQAAAKLNTLASAAGRVAHAFSGVGSVAMSLGGIAGIWQVGEAIRDVDQLYSAVNRVTNLTGMAADHAHAMFDMFELSGVEMEAAEKIITSMTRKGAQMAEGMGGVGVSAQSVASLMRRLGITIKDGPEDRIFAMSKAAQAGKLNIDELIRAFMIPRSQASAMMTMLKSGPDALKAIQKDTLTGAEVITEQALQSYRTMLQSRRELKDAWGDLVALLYKSLLPGVTAILQGIKKGFDDIKPVAEVIGKALSGHMETVVRLTKTYLALLMASKAINMFAGPEGQMGMFARGKQLASGAMGMLGKRSAAAGGIDYFAARAASPGLGMFETVGGPLTRILGTVAGRLGVIGVVVTLVITAFTMLKDNVLGLGTMFKNTLGGTFSALASAFGKVFAILGKLWSAIQPLVQLIAGALLLQLWWFAKGIELVATVIGWVVTGLVAVVNAIIWLLNKIPGVGIDMIGAKDAAKKAAADKGADNKAGTGTYQDFRGSKFSIENNFPAGMDGGRVAVAFGDELAKLGERRLDSGLRPLYSVR